MYVVLAFSGRNWRQIFFSSFSASSGYRMIGIGFVLIFFSFDNAFMSSDDSFQDFEFYVKLIEEWFVHGERI